MRQVDPTRTYDDVTWGATVVLDSEGLQIVVTGPALQDAPRVQLGTARWRSATWVTPPGVRRTARLPLRYGALPRGPVPVQVMVGDGPVLEAGVIERTGMRE